MNRTITFAVNREDGLVISRVGSEIAIPVMDFTAIGTDGDFTKPIIYNLEIFPISSITPDWDLYRWTKKIPVDLKNIHRAYWGFPKIN